MKFLLISIYDTKAEVHSKHPHQARNKADAIRSFEQVINNPESDFNKHPLDYALFIVGEYDEETGIITTQENYPLHLISGQDVIRKDD